jgi:hypothetical protein
MMFSGVVTMSRATSAHVRVEISGAGAVMTTAGCWSGSGSESIAVDSVAESLVTTAVSVGAPSSSATSAPGAWRDAYKLFGLLGSLTPSMRWSISSSLVSDVSDNTSYWLVGVREVEVAVEAVAVRAVPVEDWFDAVFLPLDRFFWAFLRWLADWVSPGTTVCFFCCCVVLDRPTVCQEAEADDEVVRVAGLVAMRWPVWQSARCSFEASVLQ